MSNLLSEPESLQIGSYSDSEVKSAVDAYPSLWAETLYNEAGLPLSFEKRKYLIDIYNDFSPKQVLLKPPQVGASTMNTLKAFYVARFLKKDIIYTMPTDAIVGDFVTGTVNRIIVQNVELSTLVADHDSVERKVVGNNIIRFRGSWNPKQAMTVPASLLMHDEIDSSDPENIVLYETRQEAQEKEEDKWRWVFSHPSLSGSGVDVYWQKSDKREWVITCPHCTQQQVMMWPQSVSREKNAFVCRKCDAELPTESRVNGFWHPTAKGEYHGYHISQLMLWNKTAKDILAAFDDPLKDKQYFYNYVLGLPYVGGDDQITVEQVLKNCAPEVNSQEGKIIIGVDPGLPVHYVCMNQEGLFFYGTCKPPAEKTDGYEELRLLMRKWPKAVIVSDQGGDLNPMRKMMFDFPGRVFIAYYRKPKKTNDLWEWGEGDKFGEVYIDRNRTIQVIIGELKETGRLKLNGTPQEFQEYADHWAAMYREKIVVKEAKDKDDRSLYGAEYVWKRRGADHWAHATVYATVGLMRYGQSLASTTAPAIFDNLQVGVADDKFSGDVILRALSEDSPF